jgi:hypothetical protein
MKISRIFLSSALIMIASALITFNSCNKDSNDSKVFLGTPARLGDGTVRSFAVVTDQGQNASLGLVLTETALNGLPTDTMPEMPFYMTEVPVTDQFKAAGIDHIELDWGPKGHAPAHIYDVPHFDIHFFRISKTEQDAILGGPDNVPVDPQYIPKDYYTPFPLSIPLMGVHYFDSLSPELHGLPFTSAFIAGFYHGKSVFDESMIARDFLLSHPDITRPIKQPAAFQVSGDYPATYEVQYNQVRHEYTIAFTDLKKY